MVLVVLGCVEGGLRLAMPALRRVSLPNDMIAAHLAGTTFRHDPDVYWYWPDPLGGPSSPVNEFGFVRAEPMTMEKPPGVTRVVTFGDSQTFGAGMLPTKTYSAFAEAALGEGWEVLNAGVSGYRSLNVYRLLQLRIAAFDPDVVVIDCMPYDSPRDHGPTVGSPLGSRGLDLPRALFWHSRLYYVLRLGLEVFDPDRPRWLDESTPGAPVPREDLGNHGLIAKWGRAHGVEVLFMEYPVMTEAGEHDCMTGEGELPEGSRVVRTCGRLKALNPSAPALFQDRNHLTEEGNQLVGGIVADAIREWAATR